VSPADGVTEAYRRGLGLLARGEHFAAHEALEEAWRAAASGERDFFQGLVHVAVAWYQAGRGNAVGCERQLEKAARRLRAFAPAHRGLDVASLLCQVAEARGRFPALPPVVLTRDPGSPAPG
jgi:predicted metal-dependent hydrolase